jgi:hypothetical protein
MQSSSPRFYAETALYRSAGEMSGSRARAGALASKIAPNRTLRVAIFELFALDFVAQQSVSGGTKASLTRPPGIRATGLRLQP